MRGDDPAFRSYVYVRSMGDVFQYWLCYDPCGRLMLCAVLWTPLGCIVSIDSSGWIVFIDPLGADCVYGTLLVTMIMDPLWSSWIMLRTLGAQEL